MNEEHQQLESVRTDSIQGSPREDFKTTFKNKLPSIGGKLSPFIFNMNREYAQMPFGSPNTGRSVTSNNEASEARHLYGDSIDVNFKKKAPGGFTSDTEEWSATHRPRKDSKDEEGDDFTFREQGDDQADSRIASVADIVTEKTAKIDQINKAKRLKRKNTVENKANQDIEEVNINEDIVKKEKKEKKKRKKVRTIDEMKVDDAVQGKTDEEAAAVHNVEEPEKVIKEKKKKSNKAKTGKKKLKKERVKEEPKEVDEKLAEPELKKPKELSIQINPSNQHNLSLSGHLETPQGIMFTEHMGLMSPPQSITPLTTQSLSPFLTKGTGFKGEDDAKSESCASPLHPTGNSLKSLTSIKKRTSSKANKMSKYKLDAEPATKPKKAKEKKPKQHNRHHEHKPKRTLLTDGLNIVKLVTDRTNCKKTKLIMILYIFSILWSIVLNGLELTFYTNTSCRAFTKNGLTYICFLIMIVLKFLSISLFNLELTFKQPYKRSIGLSYSLVVQSFCPLLQLPQNTYDFGECQAVNRVVEINQTWDFLYAVLGTMLSIMLYMIIHKINIEYLKSRIGGLISKFVKFFIVLAVVAWNFVLIVVFIAQKEIFLPSLFFDFYLYIVLLMAVGVIYRAKKKLGDDGLKALFVKDDKKLAEPLTPMLVIQNKKTEGQEKVDIKVQA